MCVVSQANAGKVLGELMEGNERFRTGEAKHPRSTEDCWKTLAQRQAPLAIIVGCSDSRVPPEILFDAGVGDLFVIRVAGNVLGRDALGSLEYAVEHLKTPLLVVLGHSDCGAISAVVRGACPLENLAGIVEAIQPAVDATEGCAGDWIDLAARENALRVVRELPSRSVVVAEAMAAGDLTLVPAYYDLETGAVDLLTADPRLSTHLPETTHCDACLSHPAYS